MPVDAADYQEYWRTKSVPLRNKIVTANLPLARSVAVKIAANTTIPWEDLFQVAALALISCVEAFNPTLGHKFSSFAVPKIRGRILNYLRDRASQIKIPRNQYDLNQKSRRIERKLAVSLGRQPSEKEIASELGISLEKLLEARGAIAACNLVASSDVIIERQSSNPPDAQLELHLDIDLGLLNWHEKWILKAYFFQGQDMGAIAKTLGLDTDGCLVQLRKALQKSRTTASVASVQGAVDWS